MTQPRPLQLALSIAIALGLLWPVLGAADESREQVYCPVIEECVSDYVAFPLLALDPAAPLPPGEIRRLLGRMDHEQEPILENPPAPGAMRDRILDGLNIHALLEGPGQKVPDFQLADPKARGTLQETEVLISDPYVGRIRGLLVAPRTGGPYPAVLAVHGHTDTPEDLLERLRLDSLAKSGFVVLLLDQRGAGADFWEDLASRYLLESGHSFLGLRIYESLLGLRVLQSLDSVQPDRVGLLGHSGGSVVSNLTVWLEEGFVAYVSDHSSVYFNVVDGWIGDETSPDMHRIHPHVNHLKAAPIPTLRAPYDYPMGMGKVIAFFRRHLENGARD